MVVAELQWRMALAAALMDLVFPVRCGGCGGGGGWLCPRCDAGLVRAPSCRCPRCGRLGSVDPCPICPGADLDGLTAVISLIGPARRAVHVLKYRQRPQLAAVLVDAAWRRGWSPSLAPVLVGIPLHPSRLRTRRYNQADLVAGALAARGGGVLAAGLERVRATPTQVGLGGAVRREALLGAFQWTAPVPPPPVVTLVDDVVTTGATLLAAARALRSAGSEAVFGVALALG